MVQHAYNPMNHAATGSVVEAAAYLGVSMVALFGALAAHFWEIILLDLFLVWLSSTLFTLGILEYRRSQLPDAENHGPEP